MKPSPRPTPDAAPFVAAQARAGHWGLAAKACLEGIAGVPANVGVLYATESFNQNLSSVLTFLRETTRIEHWVGAVAPGICGGELEIHDGGALAVMVGLLPEDSFRCFSGLDAASLRIRVGSWIAKGGPCLGLVHGDPRNPALPALLAAAAEDAGFLVGGLVSASGPPAQLADTLVSGGLSGLLLRAEVPVVTGLTQGCSPIGPAHQITDMWEGVIRRLDDRPALDVLKGDAGELMARDLRRAAGYIHVALPVAGSDMGAYTVRTLLGMDPRQGWLAVGERFEPGQTLTFVRRDANTARTDMERMVKDVARRLDGRVPRAAFYTSCIGRGRHMFGEDGAELALIRQELGEVPLAGFFGNGEICGGRLHAYTGVLTVIAGERP